MIEIVSRTMIEIVSRAMSSNPCGIRTGCEREARILLPFTPCHSKKQPQQQQQHQQPTDRERERERERGGGGGGLPAAEQLASCLKCFTLLYVRAVLEPRRM